MLTEVLLGAVALEPLRDDKAKSTRKKKEGGFAAAKHTAWHAVFPLRHLDNR
jgi:hypothetical protein